MRAKTRVALVRALVASGLLLAGAPALGASPAAADPQARRLDDVRRGGSLLEDPAHGEAAVRELDDLLPVAAARNDLRPAALAALLRGDRTAWLDTEGRLLYRDPAPSQEAATTDGAAPGTAQAPLSETFALHSQPGSTRTIYLDFDGGTVSDTYWNQDPGNAGLETSHPAWNISGTSDTFDDTERAAIQKVWARVAEDYAPWDVDVTTQDPGAAALVRSASTDAVYGVRALITPSTNAVDTLCGGGCGGIAYLGTFSTTSAGATSPADPAWVFPQNLGNDPKNIAEATSHEVGHNLGLNHDGNASAGYDGGHGGWAPIMGSAYSMPLSQFSKGDYDGANQQQDDLAVVSTYLTARADEAGPSPATAAEVPADGASAYITSRSDVDAYRLGACSQGATIAVDPASVGPNLDVAASLVDASGAVVATSNPTSAVVDRSTMSGLGAAITVPTAGSGYVVTVDGAGRGGWTSGYDDYGSIGAYRVAVSGCARTPTPQAPTAVSASASPSAASITLSWSPPADPGTSAVTGYLASIGGASPVTLSASARSTTFTGLAYDTTYDLSVTAVNASGAGTAATTQARTVARPATAPGAPQAVTAQWNRADQSVDVFWAAPASDGGSAITGYGLVLDGVSRGSAGTALSGKVYGAAPGSHTVRVVATNAVGDGARSAGAPVAVLARPANDDVAAATTLSGVSGSTSGDNAGATGATSDPAPPGSDAGAGDYSVWYSWTALASGPATFATGSDQPARDTTLAVYTASGGTLTPVGGNDDTPSSPLAAVEFPAVAGQRYLVAVDGFASTTGHGPFTLAWSAQGRAPGAPSGVAATRGDRSATVSWTAGSNGDGATTGYTVTASPGGATTTVGAASRSATLTGLSNGTAYTLSVAATNTWGSSAATAARGTVVPAGVPGRVAEPGLTLERGKVVVTWRRPATNGSRLLGYTLRVVGVSSQQVGGDVTRAVLRGLQPGRYQIRVSARNDVGAGPASPAATLRVPH